MRLPSAANLRGKMLIEVANPLDSSRGMPPTLTVCNTDSLGEQIQREFPDTRVVQALNSVKFSTRSGSRIRSHVPRIITSSDTRRGSSSHSIRLVPVRKHLPIRRERAYAAVRTVRGDGVVHVEELVFCSGAVSAPSARRLQTAAARGASESLGSGCSIAPPKARGAVGCSDELVKLSAFGAAGSPPPAAR